MAFGSTSGGLFGSTSTNSGGLFGSNTNKSGGLFGNTNTSTTTGGLFGNTNNSTSSGGLFGNTTTNTTTSGGLFGNTNKTSGGLFGSTNTSGGGLFGSSNNNNNSGGLFGNTGTTSGGLFGSSNTSSSGGLFGNKNTTTSGGLFGNTNTSGGLFGSSTNTSGGLFGNASSGGMFGNNTNNNSSGFVFNSTTSSQTQNPQVVAQEILESYDPSKPKFRFQTVMYAQVQPSQITQYQKPAELTTEQWERAIRDKPAADCVPVMIKGFEQLKQRVDHFEAGKKSTEVMLTKLKQNIAKMKQGHEAHISTIVETKKRQFALSHRLLKLLRQLAKLRAKNTPMSPEEAVTERRLKEIMRPSSKLNTLSETRDYVDDILSNMPRRYKSKTLVPDDANMVKIFEFLSKQQEDIGKVIQLISQDLNKAQKMIQT